MNDMYQLKRQEFDRTDRKNQGRPNYFNMDLHLAAVEQMITAEEIETAFYMLEHMPAWYRDNMPIEAIKLREQLYTRLYTTLDYQAVDCSKAIVGYSQGIYPGDFKISRVQAIIELVKELNRNNQNPHLVELGPGSYVVPFALMDAGCQFTYQAEGLNQANHELAIEKLAKYWDWWDEECEKPTIFISLETIEHLHNPNEIYHYALKTGIAFDHLVISTPLYCWMGGFGHWHQMDLGHLRTYTPQEFANQVVKWWPGYSYQMQLSDEIVIIGKKPKA